MIPSIWRRAPDPVPCAGSGRRALPAADVPPPEAANVATPPDRVHPSRRPGPDGAGNGQRRCPMNAATKPATNTAPRRRAMPVTAFALLLGGCALAPTAPQSAQLFNDDAFPAPSERPDAAQVFALNDAMRAYLRTEIAASVREQMGPRRGLVAGLYRSGGLKLEYDSAMTRNAAQAFDGAHRQLPVAGHHDRRLRQGDGPAGAIPGGGRRRDLQPQRRHPVFDRPRQPDAGHHAERHRVPQPRRRSADRRLPAARGPARRAACDASTSRPSSRCT